MRTIAFPIAGRPGERGDASKARPGGADWSTLTLAASLKEMGVRPVVFVHQDGPTVDYVEEMGLEAKVMPFEPIVKRDRLTQGKIDDLMEHVPVAAEALKAYGVDAVHTNDASLHRTWGAFKQRLGFVHIWHERGLFQHPELAKAFLSSADKVLTISEFVKEKAPEDLQHRIEVIDNPVRIDVSQFDRDKDRTWLRQDLGLPEDAEVFTMIANANKRKRWDIFFEAAACAVRKNPKQFFVAVGLTVQSEIQPLRKQFIKPDIEKNILIPGYRYDALRIVSGSDALVATADDEPLGRTIIEAGVLKTPLLASARGGHAELLSDIAPMCLVKSRNPAALCRRMNEIDTTRQKFSEVADDLSASFQYRFDPKRHTRQIIEIYENL